MGMGASTLPLLMKLKQQGHIANGSAVIEIGAQQLDDSFIKATRDIAATGRLFGATTPPPAFAWTGARSDTNLLAGAPLAREFWTWLGLDYASIDIDGSPGSIPLDLNHDEVPAELVGRYDIVTNFGTTEHVANQLQSFKIIHDLAAAGAVMLHVLPAGGTPNHGLVSYNPKFFWMLGRSNGYKIAFMTMGQSDRDAGLPDDLVEFLALYEPQAKSEFAAYTMPVTSVVVALQKVFDTPFVAPFDVPTGTTTEHAALRERYWSVLKPDVSFAARERDLLARISGGLRSRAILGCRRGRSGATQARHLRARTVCRGTRMDQIYHFCAGQAVVQSAAMAIRTRTAVAGRCEAQDVWCGQCEA